MGLDGGTIPTRSDILRGQSWRLANSDSGAQRALIQQTQSLPELGTWDAARMDASPRVQTPLWSDDAVGLGFAGSALSASMYDGACPSPPSRDAWNTVISLSGREGDSAASSGLPRPRRVDPSAFPAMRFSRYSPKEPCLTPTTPF